MKGWPVKLGLSKKLECLATLCFLCMSIPNTLEFIYQYTTGTTYSNYLNSVGLLLIHYYIRLNGFYIFSAVFLETSVIIVTFMIHACFDILFNKK